MEQILFQSRIALNHLLYIVGGVETRTVSNKNAGTLQPRQNHFIKFIQKIKLGNNVALKGYTPLVRNLIMSCCATDLAAGENLVCKTIKEKTIKTHLAGVADLSIHSQMMYQPLNLMGKQSKFISDVLHELNVGKRCLIDEN